MDWHRRYVQQARWTRDLRRYLFAKSGAGPGKHILEVGCGTGAVLQDMLPSGADHAFLFGLDIDVRSLRECAIHAPRASLMLGDALSLPVAEHSMDIAYCHFLLLWVRSPIAALREMKRVTKPGGFVLALAEPDYSQRVDAPADLVELGSLQTESLRLQGAHVSLGASLPDLFRESGIRATEAGRLDFGTDDLRSAQNASEEWDVMESDLRRILPEQDVAHWKERDRRARDRGQRLLRVPTYFACGQV